MLTILTYQLKPYLLVGEPLEPLLKPGAEWLRDIVNMLMVRHREHLTKAGIDTSIFHNHDEKTSHTLPPYPRILYQNHNGIFLVTGINEGAVALAALAAFYPQPVSVGHKLFVGFAPYRVQESGIVKTESPITYKISNYLALDQKTHKEYQAATAIQKLQLLEGRLLKHLVADLFHYLHIDIPEPRLELLDMLSSGQRSLTYRSHHYLAFNMVFGLDVQLPDFLALGNGKAFGYGVIERG